MKCDFIYEDFSLSFDKDKNPILDNSASVKDYKILEDIFYNPNIMKTTTVFAGQVPGSEKDFHTMLSGFLHREPYFCKDFALRKIYTLHSNKLIGISGLIESKDNFLNKLSFDIILLIKEEFQMTLYGFFLQEELIAQAPDDSFLFVSTMNNVILKYCKRKNFKVIKVQNKSYKGKTVLVHYFVLFKSKENNILNTKVSCEISHFLTNKIFYEIL